MKKILLVLEDYNELIFAETLLKKMGFDCIGLQSESGLADKIMGFSPHLVLTEGFGQRFNGMQMSQKTKRTRGLPKFLLILNRDKTIDETDRQRLMIDEVMARPVHPVDLIEKVGGVLGLDVGALKDRMQKLGLFQEAAKEKLTVVTGKIATSPSTREVTRLKETSLSSEERSRKFRKAVEELPVPTKDGLDRKKVIEQTRDFRARESDRELQAIDEERHAFVKALFRKK